MTQSLALISVAGLLFAAGPPAGQAPAPAPAVIIAERPLDPHGSPRPARGSRDVPLKTSLYVELGQPRGAAPNPVEPKSVTVELRREGGAPVRLLGPGQTFARGASGWLRTRHDMQRVPSLAVYVDPGFALEPGSKYTVSVSGAPIKGNPPAAAIGQWEFTTEAAPAAHPLAFTVDLAAKPVRWHGRFFSGLCNVIFCTEASGYGPTYDLMAEARRQHPRAWSFQRDFWMTGSEFSPPGMFPQRLPNIVRERETRRIASIGPRDGKVVLHLEDVFGHEQYGVPPGRPVADDYHPGDEVLVADGTHDARAKVVSVDSAARTVTLDALTTPDGGWKIAYEQPLPTREDPDAPGLFPPGGCYLRKFAPVGTPCYYWGRLDKEWDLAFRKYDRRVLVNFADAAGDLARDGRSWTTVKDLAQWHEVARTIAGHVIDRYGAKALASPWSVFNEPDLGPVFWRADWDELQRFYDYTTDAILRAVEDRGHDGDRVQVGGLELAAIFGVNLKLREFLAHCSPRATAKGALPLNAAFADRRLDGKRSKRVERLCSANGGKGAPCDFISIHSYNRASLMADKLIKAKETALEIDADYYRSLWIDSHESCPDWAPPPDEAASDAYLGNGYFPTWCLDVAHRQLERAAADPRHGYGETILTVWPPPVNFTGINAVTRIVHVDDDGNGAGDRTLTVPMPIFHVLGLLSDLGDDYTVLPARTLGGHRVGGFASRDGQGVARVALHAHHAQDTQSRSDASFDVTLDLRGLGGGVSKSVEVTEYHFDRDHNTPFREARVLRDRPAGKGTSDPDRRASVSQALEGDDEKAARAALADVPRLAPVDRQAVLGAALRLAQNAKEEATREAARVAVRSAFAPQAYPAADVERVRALTGCAPTGTRTITAAADGGLRLPVRLAGNGCVFLTVRPAPK